jgi:hypothetical protein
MEERMSLKPGQIIKNRSTKHQMTFRQDDAGWLVEDMTTGAIVRANNRRHAEQLVRQPITDVA